MSDLNGTPGELRMTLMITRAATGETETVELVGKAVIGEPAGDSAGETNVKEQDNGSHSLDSGA